MSQVLFRTTKQDRLDKGKTKIVFELVVHVKQGLGGANGEPTCLQMSCGWCAIDYNDLNRAITTEIPILGGNPASEMQISQNDVRAGRSGINAIKKLVAGGVVDKRLKVQITPLARLQDDVKYHMTMMPSTCLVHRNLLHFVSAFMNYKARKLLEE